MLKPVRVAALAICVLVLSAARASQSRWLDLGMGNDPIVQIDTTRVRTADRHYVAWVQYTYKTSRPIRDAARRPTGRTYRRVLQLEGFDCDRRRLQTVRAVYYSAAGDLVHEWGDGNLSEYAWEEPIPETIGEDLARKGCAYLAVR